MSSMPEWWTIPYPEVSSAKAATDYLDAIGAALSRYDDGDMYVLATGPQELIRAETPQELDTFVLGFALAHLICERFGLIGARPGTSEANAPSNAADDEPPVVAEVGVVDVAEETAVVEEAGIVADVPPPDEPAAPVQTLTPVPDLNDDTGDDIAHPEDIAPGEDGVEENGAVEERVAQGRPGRRRGRR